MVPIEQLLSAILLLLVISSSPACGYRVDGGDVWDRVFASRRPINVIPKDGTHTSDGTPISFIWTEGPLFVKKNNTLLFSDTSAAKIYEWRVNSSSSSKNIVNIYAKNAGDIPPDEAGWRGETGSNGLFLTPPDGRDLLVCQHGARRLAAMDPLTGLRREVASHWDGKRLNGPNDVIARMENGEVVAYFTDPPYALYEKGKWRDEPYLDAAVISKGAGACSVYRVVVPSSSSSSSSTPSKVDRLFSMDRPNGLQFKGDKLIIAESCGGSNTAIPNCQGGTSRWRVYETNDVTHRGGWHSTMVIEDQLPAGTPGASDGFSLDAKTGLLLASCVGGVCVVDVEAGQVLARLHTTQDGWKTSNTIIGDDNLYITGSHGVWALPLNPDRVYVQNGPVIG